MDSPENPAAFVGGPRPRVGRTAVHGTRLYAEVRGEGAAVLLIGAADEDAEIWRAVAERLPGRTVVTYDRRGTRRSGRERWPTGSSAQHADDAAGLMAALGLGPAVVFGASAGGIVALQLALRHPKRIHRALLFEPGHLRLAHGGERLQAASEQVVADYLRDHPADWAGASAMLADWAAAAIPAGRRGLLSVPPGQAWYARRVAENAEAFVREDLHLTAELPDAAALGSSPVELRFASGTASAPAFRQVVTRLAALGDHPLDVLEGVGHLAYLEPDRVAPYILAHS